VEEAANVTQKWNDENKRLIEPIWNKYDANAGQGSVCMSACIHMCGEIVYWCVNMLSMCIVCVNMCVCVFVCVCSRWNSECGRV